MPNPHVTNDRGEWFCSALFKTVKVPTTRDGSLACGHCIHFVTNADGKKIPWTMRDQLLSRK